MQKRVLSGQTASVGWSGGSNHSFAKKINFIPKEDAEIGKVLQFLASPTSSVECYLFELAHLLVPFFQPHPPLLASSSPLRLVALLLTLTAQGWTTLLSS